MGKIRHSWVDRVGILPGVYYNYRYDFLFVVFLGDYPGHYYYQIKEDSTGIGEFFFDEDVFSYSTYIGKFDE